MPKRNLIWIAAILVAVLVLILIGRGPRSPMGGYQIRHQPVALVAKAIQDDCLWPVDGPALDTVGIEAMVRAVDHGWTRWVPASRARRLDEHLAGQAYGTGMTVVLEDRVWVIRQVVFEGPAWQAGLRTGDRIATINGHPSAAAPDVPDGLLDGSLRQTVTLTLVDDADAEDITVKPGKYDINSVKGLWRNAEGEWTYFLDDDSSYAYIRISEFTNRTEAELNHAMRDLDDAAGLVLDLRGNPGGPLEAVLEVVDRFMGEGTIVHVASREKVRTHTAGRRTVWDDKPVVILVNGETVSAAELLAGALQHAGRAGLVGQPTDGKRFIQTVIPIEDAGHLVLTTGYYAFDPIPVDAKGEPIIAYQGLIPVLPDAFVAFDGVQWDDVQERWAEDELPALTGTTDRSARILEQDSELQVAVARLIERCDDE
jgi:C-terminal peptidase prc